MSYQPYPQPPAKKKRLPVILGSVGAAVLLCLGGVAVAAISGGDGDDDGSFADGYAQGVAQARSAAAAATSPTTATSPTAVATQATTAPQATAVVTAAPAKTPAKAPTTRPAVKKPTTLKVPDGVGLDYQSAQDRWRAAGLVVAPAIDATGAHRLPVIDANWVVLAQDLKAGSRAAAGSVITATVKKYSDD
ncbi:PASTA domain-containing protein [Actinoplanes sp. URMC 104]|uniref:PASTA domain-containing protein n=1 Tax=Actinoplanes sp. URMC 104 TaxID=3423409 RepID=UPI003F1B63CC